MQQTLAITQHNGRNHLGFVALSAQDPSILPPGSVYNLFTRLNATLHTTARRGVPAGAWSKTLQFWTSSAAATR